MSQIVASNERVLSQLNTAVSFLNSPLSFRLFSNPVTLTPATALLDLIESAFPGYTRLATTGKFGPPFKVTDGRYQSSSSSFDVTCTADSAESVYGWSISLGSRLYYSALFPEPIQALNGRLFSIVVAIQEASLSLCH